MICFHFLVSILFSFISPITFFSLELFPFVGFSNLYSIHYLEKYLLPGFPASLAPQFSLFHGAYLLLSLETWYCRFKSCLLHCILISLDLFLTSQMLSDASKWPGLHEWINCWTLKVFEGELQTGLLYLFEMKVSVIFFNLP